LTVLSVLLALRRQHSLGTFFRFLDGKHEAIAILTNYGKKYDKDVIKDFWFQDDRRTESACFELDEAALLSASTSGDEGRTEILTAEQFSAKMDHIRAASKTFGEDRDRSFEAKVGSSSALDQRAILKLSSCRHARISSICWPFSRHYSRKQALRF
jgi:hypothetical protein